MSNTVTSPNMQLPVPIVGTEAGPQYATDINTSLNLIDAHNHTSGSGVQITPSGLNINADLPINSQNLTLARTIRFTSQSSPITATSPDLTCAYVANGDLYYNDGSGNQVRITQGGSIAGASGTISGLPSGTASASFQAASGTFVWQQATSTAANMDAGTLIIRYPGSYPSPSGNYIGLRAPTSLSTGYNLTLPGVGAVNNSIMVLGTTGVMSSVGAFDQSTITSNGSVVKVPASGITTTEIANLSVTAAKIANSTITATQISGSAGILGSQLSASADIAGSQLALNTSLNGKEVKCSGQDIVVSSYNPATNQLQIACLSVTGSTGAISSGGGATVVRNSSTSFSLTWTPVFFAGVTPQVAVQTVGAGTATVASVSSTGLDITLSFANANFSVIAIGPRA